MAVDYPAALPPSDVTPNFVNPVSQASVLVVVSIFCLFFMVVLHLQRMLVKFRTNHRWGLDDGKYSPYYGGLVLISLSLLYARKGIDEANRRIISTC